MKPGDIVLIRFPQTDLQAGKLRPALVVAIAPGRSVIRLGRLATVDASVINARLGEVGSHHMVSVRRRLGAWLHV